MHRDSHAQAGMKEDPDAIVDKKDISFISLDVHKRGRIQFIQDIYQSTAMRHRENSLSKLEREKGTYKQ